MADTFEFKGIADTAYSIAQESVASRYYTSLSRIFQSLQCFFYTYINPLYYIPYSLEGKKYTAAKVSEWIESIGGECLARLRATSPNFKYIVNIAIIQQAGAGLHMETCQYY